MKTKAVFYHAGPKCQPCVNAKEGLVPSLDEERYDLELVNLVENKGRIPEAEARGVKSVPALVIGESAFHINFGANLSDLA